MTLELHNILRKIVTVAALIAIFLFAEGCMAHKGPPWVLSFTPVDANMSSLIISNERILRGSVTIFIPSHMGIVTEAQTVAVLSGIEIIPLGQIEFADTTRQPGRVVLRISHVVIDIMPKALSINGDEINWNDAKRTPITLIP